MTSQTPTIYCTNHPTIETNLRCNRCEKPICSKCAIQTPTGYRCQDCVRNQQKVFDTALWYDYIFAIAIGFILSYVGSRLVPILNFFIIFLAPIAGMIIAEAIRAAIRRRRSNLLFILSGIAVALGALIPIIFWLLSGFLSLTLIWQGVYAFVVTSTVYYRLRGIRM